MKLSLGKSFSCRGCNRNILLEKHINKCKCGVQYKVLYQNENSGTTITKYWR